MNPRKVAFIYCFNDNHLYAESVKYLQSLRIPEGFEIDIFAVEDAESMAAGYNAAMQQSDAKYKVYLHQDVLILNKNFIEDVISLFNKYPKLGILGLSGAKTILPSANWNDSYSKYGKVYDSHTGKMELHNFREISGEYESVKALDGFILITQYDIAWQEHLLHGWDFYHLSQCLEFIKAGYEVGIPRQDKPWAMHDCGEGDVGTGSGYEEEKEQFLAAYSKMLFPKVSILIPTYNRPHYFELALQSALRQTYKHIEIVICDDSTNDETEKLIQGYLADYPNIRYVKNEKNLGQFDNDLKCLDLATGEYVNFLMDDDLFHPRKIEKMMQYFLDEAGSEIALVTSRRQLIDAEGNYLPDISATKPLFEKDTIMDGKEFGDTYFFVGTNVIGEPTTVLFRKKDLSEPFGVLCNRKYICNVDKAAWTNLLTKGKIVYIADTLSYFRFHNDQKLKSVDMLVGGALDYAHHVLNARKLNFLDHTLWYLKLISLCKKYLVQIKQKLSEQNHRHPLYAELLKCEQALENKANDLKRELPLVSVLIPAYNRPHYLELALKSALAQTYENIEIIVCDDSTNDDVEKMIQSYLISNKNIRYYKNEKTLGSENFQKLLRLARGEYVNYLMDDDLFHENKIEKMVPYLMEDREVKLVTSHRELIDEEGNIMPETSNRRLWDHNEIFDGKAFGDVVLKNLANLIGEPTTVLFRKQDIEKFGKFRDKEYFFINDLATWIELLSKGKGVYLADSLSYFRQHPNQNQRNPKYMVYNIPDWYDLLNESRKRGFLRSQADYKQSLNNFISLARTIVDEYIRMNRCDILKECDVQKYFIKALNSLVNEPNFYECNFCCKTFERFVPWPDKYDFPSVIFEMSNKYTAICPYCRSMDRERLIKYYMEKENKIPASRLLHMAPETNMKNWLAGKVDEYICGDLFPTDESIQKIDITCIPYDNDYFDVVLCSHVLEHIPDDIAAIRELYRVMKPGGWGILQVPIATSLEKTFEDPFITSDEARLEAFGQEDHVRIYAKDYVERLKSAGFQVELYNIAAKYGKEEAEKYGLSISDNLYVVKK